MSGQSGYNTGGPQPSGARPVAALHFMSPG